MNHYAHMRVQTKINIMMILLKLIIGYVLIAILDL